MAVLKVKIGGVDVTFQSEDDFARAFGALKRTEDAPEKNPRRSPQEGTPAKGFNALPATVEFLTELVRHPEGMHSNIVAGALKCDPRGIGRRLLEVDDVLKPLGFKREKVYDNSKRLAEGGRVYLPGTDASAALEAVKRKAGSG